MLVDKGHSVLLGQNAGEVAGIKKIQTKAIEKYTL
jgi:hypothetical protein